jgi:hypothetical protein
MRLLLAPSIVPEAVDAAGDTGKVGDVDGRSSA